jgi:hypothetical protein
VAANSVPSTGARFPLDENSRDSLNDYLLLGLEWKLLRGRLKVGPLGVALEVDDPADPAGTWGLVLSPELNFFPVDAAQLTAGQRWFAGEPGTTFGGQKEAAELHFKAVFSFLAASDKLYTIRPGVL